MFWKKIKSFSIRTKLTFFYSTSTFILIFIVGSLLYWGTLNVLYRADYQFLSDEIDTIQYVLHNKTNKEDLQQEIFPEMSADQHTLYRYYVRLFDQHHQLILSTPGIKQIIPDNQPLHDGKISKKRYWWLTKNNTHYLLAQAPVKSAANNSLGIVEVLLDVSYQHQLIHDRKTIAILLFCAALGAFFIGLFISHRGVRSLYTLTKKTQEISAASLHQRIDPKSWPKELVELGMAFNQMLDRIETSFANLQQFSADLAHELRTPINNLIGQNEIALAHSTSDIDYQQVLASNLEELQHTTQLIENILFLARTDHPKLHLEKTPLAAHDEIEKISDFFQAMADDKKITLHREGKLSLCANKLMLRRALSNLLSNAIHFTEPGGRIDIIAKTSGEIEFRDTGIGISAQHLPNLFNRFYRVDSARAKATGGTGLGLAIVKSIMSLHEGTVTVASTPGLGTTVTLTFPQQH